MGYIHKMKNYHIRLVYSAEVLEVLDTCGEEFEDLEELYQRAVEDEEFDVDQEITYTNSVNELYVDDAEIAFGQWQEDFDDLEIPQTGLCRTGGWCRGASDLDLALPEEEVFDSKKLCIKSCSEVSYLLNENTIIKAVFDDDNYDDGESGDTYYYNGDCLE